MLVIAIPEAASRPSRRPVARTPLRARARSRVMSGDVVNTFGDEFDGSPFREVVRALPPRTTRGIPRRWAPAPRRLPARALDLT